MQNTFHSRWTKRVLTLASLLLALVFSLGLTSFTATTASAAESPTGTISGKVTAKGNDNFTMLLTNNASVTFQTNTATQFIQNGKNATFGDMKTGMLVGAVVTSQGNGKPYLALKVTLPTSDQGSCYTSGMLTATVAGLTSNSFLVKWANGETSRVPFLVNGDTKFFQDGRAASFADLKVGQSIQFQIKSCGDGKYHALKVLLPSANHNTCSNPYTSGILNATVTGLTANSFMVKWTNGETSRVPFLVNGDTRFFRGSQSVGFSDLHIGQAIHFQVKSCGDGKYYALKVYFQI